MKPIREILESIFSNGRVSQDAGWAEIENEFDFEASEQGWTDQEIKEAISSDWFPKGE